MKAVFFFAAFTILAVKPTRAFEDDHDLLAAASPEAGMKWLLFVGYVRGLVDGTLVNSAIYQQLPPIRLKEKTTGNDLADVVPRFVSHGSIYGIGHNTSQVFLKLSAQSIVSMALRSFYRCGD